MVDSFELSKIAGGILAALLVIFLPKVAIEIAHQSHGHEEIKDGYVLPAPTETEASGSAEGAPAAAFDPAAVVAMLPTAKPENAASTFKKCLGCHTADKAAASKAGPNLWGVLGRERGTRADFTGYSEAMKSKTGAWTYGDLVHFLHKPKEFVPGTKMVFPGISDLADLADVVAYIRTLSDNPEPWPTAAAAPAPAPGAAPAAAAEPK
ncbi:MAG: cytochrome c family protein [Hyphomicrobium sp.]|uniref:c-type cytochrome n=1 Tax=Hyphomicrobium sp. TaxID=82 RepID=UPI003D0CE28A